MQLVWFMGLIVTFYIKKKPFLKSSFSIIKETEAMSNCGIKKFTKITE